MRPLEALEALCCVHEQDTFVLCLVLVQPGKTGKQPDMTEKVLTGTKCINRTQNPNLRKQYSVKPDLSDHSKRRPKIGFPDRLSLNAGQKYCRMLQESILQYFRPSLNYHMSVKTFVLSIFEWPLKTGFTVVSNQAFGLEASNMTASDNNFFTFGIK